MRDLGPIFEDQQRGHLSQHERITCLANLVRHGIDQPNVWHGNTLTGQEIYGGLFADAPSLFDVVLTNPPFGGKEGREVAEAVT